MGVGQAIFYASLLLFVAAGLTVGITVLVRVLRARPRNLSDTLAERIRQTAQDDAAGIDWAQLGRQVMEWPEHDGIDEECWCRRCFAAVLVDLQDAEVDNLFAGLADTPGMRELADRARRWVR